MQPPLFWFTSPDRPQWRARALAPLAALYACATAHRVARPGMTADVPVISVGNLNLGGTGKTPVVIALVELLLRAGHRPHVVSRGYGGSETGPVQVDPKAHTAPQMGDEPLLLAAFAPTWVAKDRASGVRQAQSNGASVILLDDAHQNPDVVKDLSIVVVDAGVGFGNGRVVPAGPLREPVSVGLHRADLILLIGSPAQRRDFLLAHDGLSVPVVQAELTPLQTGMDWQDMPVFAFAGIGRPAKFFATVQALGARLVGTRALDDHQPLTPALLKRIQAEASALGAQLVTTEKDAVRLPPALRMQVLTVPVRLDISDRAVLDGALQDAGISVSDRP